MDWHDNFAGNMIITLLVGCTIFIIAYQLYIDNKCQTYCENDSLVKCYNDNVICANKDKVYMKALK